MRVRTLLLGGLIGAAIAYFSDPVSGRGRRTRLRDQAMARARDARRRSGSRARYTLHATRGKLAEMASPGPDTPFVDDATLTQRIRSAVFGRADVADDRISLDVADGVATLRGELDAQDEIDALARRVRAVAGVRDVVSLMHLPGSPAPNKEDALEASQGAEDAAEHQSRSFG